MLYALKKKQPIWAVGIFDFFENINKANLAVQ